MVLTTELLNEIRDNTQTQISDDFTYGAVGDDNTPATAGDTTLANEVFRSARDDVDVTTPGQVIATLIIGSAEANGNDLKEFGWLNAASSGTLWTRDIMTSITKTSDITLYLDSTITITVEED